AAADNPDAAPRMTDQGPVLGPISYLRLPGHGDAVTPAGTAASRGDGSTAGSTKAVTSGGGTGGTSRPQSPAVVAGVLLTAPSSALTDGTRGGSSVPSASQEGTHAGAASGTHVSGGSAKA